MRWNVSRSQLFRFPTHGRFRRGLAVKCDLYGNSRPRGAARPSGQGTVVDPESSDLGVDELGVADPPEMPSVP